MPSFVTGSTIVCTIAEERLRDVVRIGQIKEQALAAVQGSLARNVVLDLSHVQFIGSMGFLVFLAIRRIPLVERVILCNLIDSVKEMFAISKLIPGADSPNAPFELADSVESAIERCNS